MFIETLLAIKLKTTQMYFNGYLVKLMVAHLHHDAISNKKEPTVVTTAWYFVTYAE